MTKPSETPVHPGSFIKKHVIPTGMTVTDAAKRLGVGRPALSNLLNGNSSLSPNMAIRLERSFGADGRKLLDLQAAFDRDGRKAEGSHIATRTYVPAFLQLKAEQIEDWTEGKTDPGHQLSVLLRKLVHSTGHEVQQVRFPGYGNADRKGWNCRMEADSSTPWIPEGNSLWEFGIGKDLQRRAEIAYAARMGSISPVERSNSTLVFVTPRIWPGKTEWVRMKNAERGWNEVRVLDAVDLEQWLEESIPAQVWLSEQLGCPTRGFETLDRSWQRWQEACDPQITSKMFEPWVNAYRETFNRWLDGRNNRPLRVSADSVDEALAFLSCLFRDRAIPLRSKDLATVFKSGEALRTLAESSSPFIPIVHTQEGERELEALYGRLHCIIVRPRYAIDFGADIAPDPLDHNAFITALSDMGIEDDEAKRLARESGLSPSILRRRLSRLEDIRNPPWSIDPKAARSLIPMALVGSWHAKSEDDREILALLVHRQYRKVEEDIRHLSQFNDTPVWSVGGYLGVASKIDCLFGLNKYVTREDLEGFFDLAEFVLSRRDPKLDQPGGKRGPAGRNGKERNPSTVLLDGLCDTLVILSIHGNYLFRDRLGIDVATRVSSLIERLLTPLTLETLLWHDKNLPHFAEAAPGLFLELIEADLRQPHPVSTGRLNPLEGGTLFNSPPGTGLLWALECLGWKHLGRVSLILAQLSRVLIDNNWGHRPISSLKAILWSRLPQTAASLDERIKALEILTDRSPEIGWEICISQFQGGSGSGHFSHRPRWRNDASGVGRSVSQEEFEEFRSKSLALALVLPEHNQNTLGALVERLPEMSEDSRILVWNRIETWADAESDERAKADLRERIRVIAFTRQGRGYGLNQATMDRARRVYKMLQPRDPVDRHAWLFAQHWVDPSSDEIEDEAFSLADQGEIIRTLRIEAMREIWGKCGFEGLNVLLSLSDAPTTIGRSLGPSIPTEKAQIDFLRKCLASTGTGDLNREMEGCIQGFLESVNEKALGALLSEVCEDMDSNGMVQLLRYAPFNQNTWRLLNQFGQEIRHRYWQEVLPLWHHYSDEACNFIIDRLLEARRPRAAFQAVRPAWSKIETSRLRRLLLCIATVDAEPSDGYSLEANDLSDALDSLNSRMGAHPDQMAQLEFLLFTSLEYSKHGIPNLELQVAQSPPLFAQVLALAFKHNDEGQDPPEWKFADSQRREELASIAYRILSRIGRIPGTDAEGKVHAEELTDWIAGVRRLCAQQGHAELGDQKIGELLSRAPAEEDGSWPCLSVCEAIEGIGSQHIATGLHIGVYNRRGEGWRGIGKEGTQEGEPGAKYRGWAQERAFHYPYVSSVLERIAADYGQQGQRKDDK